MALYSEKVMDHFRNPRNVGVIEDADGVGEVGNAVCGDIMKIYLKIEDDTVTDVKFETFGCGSAIASSSMATESAPPETAHSTVDPAGLRPCSWRKSSTVFSMTDPPSTALAGRAFLFLERLRSP